MSGVDLSRPSFRGAQHFARETAFAHMRGQGRFTLNEADREVGNAVLCRLFWHVEGAQGGFMGLTDKALAERAAHYRLDLKAVQTAAWAPGNWPASAPAKAMGEA